MVCSLVLPLIARRPRAKDVAQSTASLRVAA